LADGYRRMKKIRAFLESLLLTSGLDKSWTVVFRFVHLCYKIHSISGVQKKKKYPGHTPFFHLIYTLSGWYD